MTLSCPTCPHYADCYRDGACPQASRCASGGVDTAVLDGVMRGFDVGSYRAMVNFGHDGDFWHCVITERYRRALASAAADEVGACRQPETGLPRTTKLAAGALAASVALFSWGAHAAPPPEGSPDGEMMRGYEADILKMRNQRSEICCSTSDGRTIPANLFRWSDGHEEVLYNRAAWEAGTASLGYTTGEWLPVPDYAQTTRLTPVAMTMVWILDFGNPFVRCVAPLGSY